MINTTDSIALPSDLTAAFAKGIARGFGVTIYRGVVVEEKSQAWHTAESQSGRTVAEGLVRELWLKLPSGTEKHWALENNSFGVRVGNRVSVLSITHNRNESALVLVNHETGESHIAWKRNTSIRVPVIAGFLTVLWISFPVMLAIMFIIFTLSVWWRISIGREERKLEAYYEHAAEYMLQAGPA